VLADEVGLRRVSPHFEHNLKELEPWGQIARPEGPQYLRAFLVKKPALDGKTGQKSPQNWVRFFGHLCTFIGFFAEKLGSFRNFTPRHLLTSQLNLNLDQP